MRYLIKLLILLISPIFCSGQTPLDSLFKQIDSLVIMKIGEEEIFLNEGFHQSFCDESETSLSSGSKSSIEGIRQILNFQQTNENLWCSWDYELLGYRNQQLEMTLRYNSQCNYVIYSNSIQYKTDSLWSYDAFNEFLELRELKCEFVSQNLRDCYIESIGMEKRIELLNISHHDSLHATFTYKLKYR